MYSGTLSFYPSLYTIGRYGQSKIRQRFIKIYGSVINYQSKYGTLKAFGRPLFLEKTEKTAEAPVFCFFRGLTEERKSGMISIGNKL